MDILNEYLRVCEEAVRRGGREIQDWVGRFEVRHKGPADLVTQADLASQETVRRIVLGAFPEHSLLGEETLPGQPVGERTEYRWIVDPLDGTTNFVHGVPHYAVSLALERNGELLVGAVYDPSLDECFAAAAGRGAWLNGRPIHTSGVTQLSDALAAVGFPPNVKLDSPDMAVFLDMVGRCQAIRRSGSSALNLCYVAAGRFDLYWSYSTKIWDVAAGVLIVREAQGPVTSPSGGEFCLEEARFLAAATPELHAQLLEHAVGCVKRTTT
jgi:myo-inositol-1(or 4)-monophosphatase